MKISKRIRTAMPELWIVTSRFSKTVGRIEVDEEGEVVGIAGVFATQDAAEDRRNVLNNAAAQRGSATTHEVHQFADPASWYVGSTWDRPFPERASPMTYAEAFARAAEKNATDAEVQAGTSPYFATRQPSMASE
jgi:hypothetical protein